MCLEGSLFLGIFSAGIIAVGGVVMYSVSKFMPGKKFDEKISERLNEEGKSID